MPTRTVDQWLKDDFDAWLQQPGKRGRPHDPQNKRRILRWSMYGQKIEQYQDWEVLLEGCTGRVSEVGNVNKDGAMGAFNNVLNNYIYGMVCSRLADVEGWDAMEHVPATFEGPQGELLHVELDDMVRAFRVPDQRRAIVDEYEAGLKRMLVREAHEVALWYSEETGQDALLRAAPWFQYARILRNTISHKQAGVMREWPKDLKDKGITQVRWRTRSLDASMVGQPVELTHHEAILLFKDIVEYVRDKMT